MAATPWGWELVLDCSNCAPDSIRSKENVENFARELVKRIDMVPFGDPQVIHFGEGNKEGFTLIQLIQTSNISGHFANDTNAAYLNVFSCKDFDPETVRVCVMKFFAPEEIWSRLITRGV